MPLAHYRMNTAVSAILCDGDQRSAISLAAGSIVTVQLTERDLPTGPAEATMLGALHRLDSVPFLMKSQQDSGPVAQRSIKTRFRISLIFWMRTDLQERYTGPTYRSG